MVKMVPVKGQSAPPTPLLSDVGTVKQLVEGLDTFSQALLLVPPASLSLERPCLPHAGLGLRPWPREVS